MKKRLLCMVISFALAMCFMTSCINNPDAPGRASNFRIVNDETIGFDWYGDFQTSDIYMVSVYDTTGTLRGSSRSISTESLFLTGAIILNCTLKKGWHVNISVKNDMTQTLYYDD